MAQHNELGFWGEDQAAEYLRKKGYFVKITGTGPYDSLLCQ